MHPFNAAVSRPSDVTRAISGDDLLTTVVNVFPWIYIQFKGNASSTFKPQFKKNFFKAFKDI
ncbi:hypothetical protein PROFUN_04910 [Planoprotostelium fungivorum]|uniref:Uncharacterized protein n=1 Tax=Planoprotostelium fungivorum TaxID=1890364 RepID=A0A2P6NF98_9EUKA|nr:hypothetical protein PROFUN_04910 [Planoprotostelium fungivorum]